MANHPFSITAPTYEAAVAAANEFISDSNAADFDGIPATSYTITEADGLYGPYFTVAFTAAYSIVAGVRFDAPPALTDDEKIALFDAFASDPANIVEIAA